MCDRWWSSGAGWNPRGRQPLAGRRVRPAGERRSPESCVLREPVSAERRHDEVAVGLGALGVGLDVVAVLEVLVGHLALRRAQRIEGDRALGAHGVRGGLVGLALQRLLAALAIARGI